MHWDRTVDYQSQHIQSYQQILQQLHQQHWLYACRCSRKALAYLSIYPGYCRNAGYPDNASAALRLKTQDGEIGFEDLLQGWMSQNLALEQGDFIVRRRDQIIAYQFAVVIDDHRQGVNHVVRGVDLLDSTPKQLYLQQLLGYSEPKYMHLPLIVDSQGIKLSKQTLASPVDERHPSATLFLLLSLLQQNPPAELEQGAIEEQLSWAVAHWRSQTLREIRVIQQPGVD